MIRYPGCVHGPFGWTRAACSLLALLVAAIAVIVGAAFALHGFTPAGFSLAARNAARSGFVLFWLAFTARAFATLLPNPVTRAIRARRPVFGVGFAVAHFTFLGMNVAQVYVAHGGDFFALRPPIAWVLGGSVYVVIAAMALTSFPAPARRIGSKRWRLLHTFGSYLIAGTFTLSFGGRAVLGGELFYAPFFVLLLIAFAVRLYTSAAWQRCRELCGV